MADDTEFEMNLDDVLGEQNGDGFALDDVKDAGLDDFLDDVTFENHNAGFVNAASDITGNETSDESPLDDVAELNSGAPLDFASFDIDDFDAALNSFQAARAGKLPKSVPMPPQAQPKPKTEVKPEVHPDPVSATKSEVLPKTETSVAEVAPVPHEEEFKREDYSAPKPVSKPAAIQVQSGRSGQFNPSTVDETGFEENSAERQQDILNWYSGKLSDKTYEISPENMPEFLDTDKTIRVLHVTVDSTYGWNVFFDNGVFMSLRDLKEYQERHGEIPCQDGKIIYGSKTTSFERILRVVVYERPRYFSYIAK